MKTEVSTPPPFTDTDNTTAGLSTAYISPGTNHGGHTTLHGRDIPECQ
jgi:hypothetical protein